MLSFMQLSSFSLESHGHNAKPLFSDSVRLLWLGDV